MIRLPHLFPKCPLGGSPTPTENYCPAGPGYGDSYRCFWAHCSPKPRVLPLCRPSRLVASSGPLCICCSLYLKALLLTSTCQLPPSFSSAQLIPAPATHPHTPTLSTPTLPQPFFTEPITWHCLCVPHWTVDSTRTGFVCLVHC